MTDHRKSASSREKDLRSAIMRIERGRAKTGAIKLSISAVAREAGVTPALIHNHYPSIAEDIRTKIGSSSRQQRDTARAALKDERSKASDLRNRIKELEEQVARLASINEVLLMDNRVLKAASAEGSNVVAFLPQKAEDY
ncbi:TetR family transcriptional regulator [Burkholderia cepacia]|uniref:TetR family transcriptional regulator n=1 Tax=Burkholderia cepacia TaxID=292 RepID=UPI001CF48B2D|nr:TetR family transcriptional regulator [Burkholderia cepacia]MCA8323787.1 TetR family transcriptional regulator [Burkholderia cepacia]